MWLFTKSGHLNVGQHASDHDLLVIQAQQQDEIDSFIAVLDEVGGRKHGVQPPIDGDYQFAVVAQRAAVAKAVGTMILAIDYDKLTQSSFHVDLGAKPGCLLWLTRDGVQVSTVRS